MLIWKKRLLMKPADGEGGDLGGGAAVEAAPSTDTGEAAAATETSADDAAAAGAAQGDDGQSAAAATTDAATDLPTDKPVSAKVRDLLDSISSEPAQQKAETPAAAAAADDVGASTTPATPPASTGATDDPAATKAATADQEEAELLAGVNNERGKDRIKQVFAERKQLQTDMQEFRNLVQSTGMNADQFAQTMEFGRLVNAGDQESMRVALNMLDQQRALLAERLGVDAPGVDLLKGHDDLKAAVESMEIPRERALELARLRNEQATRSTAEANARRVQQDQQQFQQTVHAAQTEMQTYLESRKNEVDHLARMKVISDHFRNPANLQNFVNTYKPGQWMTTIKMMYDNIQVPKTPPAATTQPLRSRPTTIGTPAATGNTPSDRVRQRLDSMGI